MVIPDYSVTTSDGRHRAAITAATVSVTGTGVFVVCVGVEACPSNGDGYVSSSDDIGQSILVSPPPYAAGSFPIIAAV